MTVSEAKNASYFFANVKNKHKRSIMQLTVTNMNDHIIMQGFSSPRLDSSTQRSPNSSFIITPAAQIHTQWNNHGCNSLYNIVIVLHPLPFHHQMKYMKSKTCGKILHHALPQLAVHTMQSTAPHLPNFLTSFLSLFSFLRSSMLLLSIPRAFASSKCLSSPITHSLSLGLGMCFSLQKILISYE